MANLSNIQMNNAPMDLFIQGQMAAKESKQHRICQLREAYVDYDVVFGILGIKRKTQQEAGDDASIPL